MRFIIMQQQMPAIDWQELIKLEGPWGFEAHFVAKSGQIKRAYSAAATRAKRQLINRICRQVCQIWSCCQCWWHWRIWRCSYGCLAGCIDQGYLRMPRSDAWRS